MTEAINLPLQVARVKNYRWLAPFIVVVEGGTAVIMALVFHSMNLPGILQIIIPGFLLASAFFVPGLIRALMKPADITINPTSVSITPMGFFGSRGEKTESRSLGEFDRLEVSKTPTKGGYVYKIGLRGKDGKEDMFFDAPNAPAIHDYAARLGALLNLKVVDNA